MTDDRGAAAQRALDAEDRYVERGQQMVASAVTPPRLAAPPPPPPPPPPPRPARRSGRPADRGDDDVMDVAVIPTYNRPDVCREAIESIYPQVDMVLVIDNGDKEPMPHDTQNAYVHWFTQPYMEQPGNLSRAWNMGLDWARQEAEGDDLYVAVLNDDALVPEGWFRSVISNMAEHGAAAGATGPADVVLRTPGLVPLHMRMPGWAFVLNMQLAPRVDEQFVWWCGDTDLDWQCRQAGGFSMHRGPIVQNRFADQSTHGIRQEHAAADVQRFVDKWGSRPY